MANEGICRCCYKDSSDPPIPTIGIGYNLQNSDAKTVLAKYNLSLSDVLEDCEKKTTKHCLTQQEAEEIFISNSYPIAEQCADQFAPGLPPVKRAAIIDMAFMGCKKLNKFEKMQKALIKRDWNEAVKEAKHSKWSTQVQASRVQSDTDCLKGCNGGQSCSDTNANCTCIPTSDGNGFCETKELSCIISLFVPDCTKCPTSTGVCLVNTNCPRKSFCMPRAIGNSCKDPPT